MMRTVKSPTKKATNGQNKLERIQKLYFFALVKLYAQKSTPQSMQYDFCLNGVRVAIKRLQDFWQEQKTSWKEIRDISDEECPSPDSFFDDDQMPSAKHSLPTILENEEEQQDNTLQREIEFLWKVVNRLKEAENRVEIEYISKILERYKCELKQLAVDLRNSEEKNQAQDADIQQMNSQLLDQKSLLETYKKQAEDLEETYRKTQQAQPHSKIKGRQAQNSKKNLMSLDRFIEIGCQTEILNDTFDDKEYYQILYQNERDKLNSLEQRFDMLKEQYYELQSQLVSGNNEQEEYGMDHQSGPRFSNNVENDFKKELAVELLSLKNKIQVLTDQANQAEAMLIEKDQQMKDTIKSYQSQAQELTQKRAQCSVIQEEKKTMETNLKVAQTVNRKLELENTKLVSVVNSLQQQMKSINHLEKRDEKQTKSVIAKQSKDNAYRSYQNEIQTLNIENQELKKQLIDCQRQLKELSEHQRNQKTSERNQLAVAAKEIEILRNKIYQQQDIISSLERSNENLEAEHQEEMQDQNLSDAMEYLEQKDKEIDKLRTENDSLRFQLIHFEKEQSLQRSSLKISPSKPFHLDLRQSPMQKQTHPTDLGQVRDLQNLLMVMSKTLQEKEEQLQRYQQRNHHFP